MDLKTLGRAASVCKSWKRLAEHDYRFKNCVTEDQLKTTSYSFIGRLCWLLEFPNWLLKIRSFNFNQFTDYAERYVNTICEVSCTDSCTGRETDQEKSSTLSHSLHLFCSVF